MLKQIKTFCIEGRIPQLDDWREAVQIAKTEFARESQLPRVNLEGLYKRSETRMFVIETQEEKIVPMFIKSFFD